MLQDINAALFFVFKCNSNQKIKFFARLFLQNMKIACINFLPHSNVFAWAPFELDSIGCRTSAVCYSSNCYGSILFISRCFNSVKKIKVFLEKITFEFVLNCVLVMLMHIPSDKQKRKKSCRSLQSS